MRPSRGRITLWPLAVIVFGMTLAFLSVTPTVQLNSAPPSGFVSVEQPKTAHARGYWEVAVRVIQWKYNRASALPEQVPADFRLAGNAGQSANVADRADRVVYWVKLREEWLRPENWHTAYKLDLGWPLRSARSLSNAAARFLDQT